MKRLFPIVLATVIALVSIPALSQEFPQGSSTPTASDVQKHLADKVFSVKNADGTSWRLEFKANGYFFLNTNTGGSVNGQWQAEDGRLCSQIKGADRNCVDVRFHQELLHLKRTSGEIIQYLPK